MSDILRKAIALGLGITAVSREKVQQFVDELVVKGELGRNESKEVVDRLIARGEEQQSEIKRMVQDQIRKILADMDVATKQDLQELEQKKLKSSELQPCNMAIKIRHTNRYKEIVVALVRHGFGYMVEELGLFHLIALPRKWMRRNPEETAKTSGERIRLVLEELGPTFIKLGQLSSTRQDLLSEDIIKELQKLQDQVPPFFSIEEVRAIVEQELHTPMDEIFSEFSDKPLAAASIGQVHYARLRSGEAVAVKVQRPLVDKIVERDLDILLDLAALAERRVDWVAKYRIRLMLEELAKSMREELNYTHEGRNADKIARQFQGHPHVCIPKIYWECTTSKVLTQEFIDGITLNQYEELQQQGHSMKDTAEHLVKAILHQLLIEGFFHADPHPGNVIVMRDGRLAFVDFGLVGRLNEDMRDHLSTLVIAMMRKDSDGIVRALFRLGIVSDDVDTGALRQDLDILREHITISRSRRSV